MRKKIFFDTEFTGLHQKTTLISIGLISECGKMFYAEFNDFDSSQLDSWIKRYVIPKLKYYDLEICEEKFENAIFCKGNKEYIKEKLTTWLKQFGCVEMWSDCLSYDWILFNNIFDAFDETLPSNVYYIPFDLSTLFHLKGIDADVSRERFLGEDSFDKHNALWDAELIRDCYFKLTNSYSDGTILQFINGSHSYEGVWFGDNHPTREGNFWWRPILKEYLEQQSLNIWKGGQDSMEEGGKSFEQFNKFY